jgi:hypothetical protein
MQDIDNIISDCNNQINDKIIGINYLEKLKYLLIDRMKNYEITSLDNLLNSEISKKIGNNQLLIKFEEYLDSISKIKKDILHDSLCIVLTGVKTIKIYDNTDHKVFKELTIAKNTGIVLTNQTVVDELVSKNTILMNIYNMKIIKNDVEN